MNILKILMTSVKMMSYQDLSREKLIEALETMEQQIEVLEEEKQEFENLAKKNKADFENYKKKQDERKEKWQTEAERNLSKDLISVIDNFERALMAADEDSSIYQGVKMVADQLYDTLEKRGLERINAEGQEFDPRIHNAVETQEHENENRVLEQKKPGYKHKEKVLRPADVVVSESSDPDKNTEE
jgi:molecular chaperone GrpE